mgnify:FL=1
MIIRFKFIDKLPPILRDKYLLTIVLFVLWLVFLDSNNLITRHKELKNLRKLKAEMEYYSKRIEEDKIKLHELKTDNRNLEKFAREQYKMKKPNEDLYVILTPSENRKKERKTRR